MFNLFGLIQYFYFIFLKIPIPFFILGENILKIMYSCFIEDGTDPGLKNDQMITSRATLHSLAEALNCECTLLRDRCVEDGVVEEHLVRKNYDENDFLEVK